MVVGIVSLGWLVDWTCLVVVTFAVKVIFADDCGVSLLDWPVNSRNRSTLASYVSGRGSYENADRLWRLTNMLIGSPRLK